VLDQCGGLDEVNLKVAFNDVDLCLRIREHGYLIVWTPHAELYHLESASRGPDTATDKVERFREEVLWMQKRWGTVLQKDPYYNENLTLEHSDFSLAFPPRASKPWHKLITENNTMVAGKKVMEVVDER
jgi:GT2 family glycosyltransferase